MESKEIEIGKEYYYKNTHQTELIKVVQYVEGLGYFCKDAYGEYFWADSEDLDKEVL